MSSACPWETAIAATSPQAGDSRVGRTASTWPQSAAAMPQALQLFASGSTVAGWQRHAADVAWLMAQAANQRMLGLSGDFHRNRLDAYYTIGFPLHEATASGAAVRDAVVVGAHREDFGLLDIDPLQVTISLFKRGQPEDQRVLDRHTWLPV